MIDVTAQVRSALRDAHSLHRAGRLDEARASCLSALQLQPRQLEALNLLGIIAAQTGDPARAVAFFGEVLQLDPQNLAAHNNQGNALRALQQPAAAIASHDRAIAIKPDHAPSYYSRAKALHELRRYEEAIASYERAIALQPDYAEAFCNRGRALFELQRYGAALASHDKAIALRPGYAAAYVDRGRALAGLRHYEAAIESLGKAIALEPRHPGIWYIRANALYSLERFEAALESYDRAMALAPADASAYENHGNALLMLERYESALASYDKAIALDPDGNSAYGKRLHARMHICDWRDFAPEVARLAERIERNEAASNPFAVLALCGSPPLQKRAAQNWVRKECPPNDMLPALPKWSRHEKIRVGYFSADFRSHAISFLAAELFETHDRRKFELTAFSLGLNTKDEMRTRIEAAFERFLDVQRESDHDIARLARSLEIDIAVDLGGFTRGGRPRIFATRAAPLQASYLGYLGTMSADYMDYLIADDTIIPETHRKYYSERIVYLPSYQVNDSKRRFAQRRFGREELGLPSTGFVFCCFNGSYKITPGTFDGWMRILLRVPGSVLFLVGGNASLEGNLRREAHARGVAPGRIVFGAKLPVPEYLARYRAADLFLDTLPYNAGTTASDALWAGLPVLTCTGESFASRVGASLLQAVGLPELIASTPEQYEGLAVELASNPKLMADIRAKLAGDLRTTRLFNTAAFARHLETAYERMYERHHAGLAPEHIHIDA
ncbi:MAG TPA: tetratricopeptide repeat protein [Steroidobacteraceae bacterium]|nr:tetratricopeptide repeat protein [Steroidobacteraceae bacterium]